ncbi:flagellar protein FliT [Dyella tabacisoli]|uniref:Flagellar protein FliT n=2 Tax=Dyella tabacisoli TaxID=2282381 RepID=A0A369UGT3_9GAMM|nr:flagellar protein FliT [Dyella tabacisoli]RDD79756.1 flagellar protein FliT [Dyella tabacisoli]
MALAQAMLLTQAMRVAAQAADWDRLTQLEAEREPLLMQPHTVDAESKALVEAILASDRELYVQVRDARDAVAVQWRQTRAAAAYAAASPLPLPNPPLQVGEGAE